MNFIPNCYLNLHDKKIEDKSGYGFVSLFMRMKPVVKASQTMDEVKDIVETIIKFNWDGKESQLENENLKGALSIISDMDPSLYKDKESLQSIKNLLKVAMG